MKIKGVIVLFIIGVLFFTLGCIIDVVAIEFFGSLFMIPGIIGLCDIFWPEKEKTAE